VVHYSWHWAFGALGIIGLSWVGGWLFMGSEGPLAEKPAAAEAGHTLPYFCLLTAPTFLGCCTAWFGAYWSLSLGLTWFMPDLGAAVVIWRPGRARGKGYRKR
jgi:hypothetical protein